MTRLVERKAVEVFERIDDIARLELNLEDRLAALQELNIQLTHYIGNPEADTGIYQNIEHVRFCISGIKKDIAVLGAGISELQKCDFY